MIVVWSINILLFGTTIIFTIWFNIFHIRVFARIFLKLSSSRSIIFFSNFFESNTSIWTFQIWLFIVISILHLICVLSLLFIFKTIVSHHDMNYILNGMLYYLISNKSATINMIKIFSLQITLLFEKAFYHFEHFINLNNIYIFVVLPMYRDGYPEQNINQFNQSVPNYSFHPNQTMKMPNT